MSSEWISYFGYGSLVNRDTRPVDESAAAARLKGWRRVWGHRVSDLSRNPGGTSLSIEPSDSDEFIEGVVVRMPGENLAQLDAREAGYDRLCLPAAHFELPANYIDESIYVYRSTLSNQQLADQANPISQSYIDCVMAGYLRVFGHAGLEAYMRSTRAWHKPIYNDRHAPRYPRAVSVSEEQRGLFDSLIARSIEQT